MKYKKQTSRLNVKFIDADTEETLFEINNRNADNVGEIFSDYITTTLMEQEYKKGNITLPKNIIVLVSAEYTKE